MNDNQDLWLKKIWQWADENSIPQDEWIDVNIGVGYHRGIPRDKETLLSLETLVLLNFEDIKEFPDEIGNLINLKNLYLGGCYGIQKLPDTICKLKNLTLLHLGDCQRLTELPENIGHLSNLKSLVLSDPYSMKNVPQSLADIDGIKIDFTGWDSIPCGMEEVGFIREENNLIFGSEDETGVPMELLIYTNDNIVKPKEEIIKKENIHMISTKELKKYLDEHIKDAILSKEKILEGFASAYDNTDKPMSFLLSGDASSGKTHIAQTIGEFFKIEYDYDVVSYDMSSYINDNQTMDFTGTDKGYGQSGTGQLTQQVNEKPRTVVILENFDKAHHNIQRVFQSMFLDGFLKDSYGFLKDGEKVLNDGEHEYKLTKDNYDIAKENNQIEYRVKFNEAIVIITTQKGEEVYKKPKLVERLYREDYSTFDMLFESIMRNPDIKNQPQLDMYHGMKSALSTMHLVPVLPLKFEAFLEVIQDAIEEKKSKMIQVYDLPISIVGLEHILKALVLSCGPDFNLIRVKKSSVFKLFDSIIDIVRDTSDIEKIKISIDKTSKNNIDSFIKDNGVDEIFKTLFRKSLRVDLKTDSSQKDGLLSLHVKVEKKLEKAIRAEDYNAENGSLVFDIPDVSFSDIAGHKRAKEQLLEIINYLKSPEKLEEFGIELSRGMLLYGPPGTGKTMLAKAFAKEADLPFISVTGTDLLDISLLKKVFKKAYEYAPSIIFIDEIDAIGSRDGQGKDIIINQFLTELNGFSDNPEESIFVVAATNLKEKLDPAILRSGRIDLHVEIPILDKESRGYFLDKILSKPTVGKIDRDKLIMFTAGLSGADLEKINRQSSLEVIRKGKKGLTQDIIVEQVNILKYGERIASKALDKTLESTAYHEAGHAVISKLLSPDTKIEQIVVTPRNETLGFVSFNIEGDFKNFTFDDLKNKMCVAYAGRVAQMKKYGNKGLDSGASSDLAYAMRYGYVAIAQLGMDEELGYINNEGLKLPSIEEKIQDRLSLLISEMTKRTQKLVDENWKDIEKIAKVLIEEEFIDEEQFYKVLNDE